MPLKEGPSISADDTVARLIDDPSIDPVLEALFMRWWRRFDLKKRTPQHKENVSLWRAFGSMRTHTRFRHVRDYDLRIAELLLLPMRWFHRQELVETIAMAPRAYIRIEMLLLKTASFDHSLIEDVDRLDELANSLFRLTEA